MRSGNGSPAPPALRALVDDLGRFSVVGPNLGDRDLDRLGTPLGYPGLILDPSAPAVEVYLFESADLDDCSRLDEFEGSGYRRVVTQVRLADGELSANIYVLAI